jgi:hypothetical protein
MSLVAYSSKVAFKWTQHLLSLFCECDSQRHALIPFRLQNDFVIDVLDGGTFTIKSMNYDAQIKKYEMVGAYGMNGGMERRVKDFGMQT